MPCGGGARLQEGGGREEEICILSILPSTFYQLQRHQQITSLKKNKGRTSPLVQRLRIHLPMEGAQVQSLFRELRSQKPRGNTAWVPQLLSSLTPQRRPDAASECINVFKEELGKLISELEVGLK